MESRVLVRRPEITLGVVVIVFGVIALILGVVVAITTAAKPGIIAAAGGAVLAFVGIGLIMRQYRLRVWARELPDGIELEDAEGRRIIRDDAVVALAHQSAVDYVNGVAKTVTRKSRIWALGDEPKPELISLNTRVKLDEPAPLAHFINRLTNRLLEQARADQKAGRKLLGERWSIEGNQLTLSPKKKPEAAYDLADLAAIDVVAKEICVWRKGEPLPEAGIPIDSANAHLLHMLLKERFEATGAEQPAAAGELGRIMFERKSEKSTIGLTLVLAILLPVIGVILLFAAPGNKEPEGLYIGGACLIAGGLLLGWLVYYLRTWRFRCHQQGVYYRGLRSEQKLMYTEVEELTYSATRMYHNGAYTGTNFALEFATDTEPKRKLRYSGTIRNADDDLDHLRDHVAQHIAYRWLQRFDKGETIRWTANLTFRPDGIVYRPVGWTGRKDAEFLPWAELVGTNLHQGSMGLFAKAQKKPVTTEATSAKNFYPGYYVLGSLLSRRAGAGEA